jgi:hypothetical protein
VTPLNAVVKNGRLTLNEPTELPEGQVVVLLPLEELLEAADGFGSTSGGVTLEIVPGSAPRNWKKTKPLDAAALLDELRSL